MSDSRPRMRVAPIPYARLRKEILARDNWRCQVCGCFRNLDVHHLQRRSALGDDTEANLISEIATKRCTKPTAKPLALVLLLSSMTISCDHRVAGMSKSPEVVPTGSDEIELNQRCVPVADGQVRQAAEIRAGCALLMCASLMPFFGA